MSEREKNDLIAEAVLSRTADRRTAKLLRDRLRNLGDQLKQIGNYLSPHDGREALWETADSNILMLGSRAEDALNIDKIRALIAELVELQHAIEEKTDTLRKYGAE